MGNCYALLASIGYGIWVDECGREPSLSDLESASSSEGANQQPGAPTCGTLRTLQRRFEPLKEVQLADVLFVLLENSRIKYQCNKRGGFGFCLESL